MKIGSLPCALVAVSQLVFGLVAGQTTYTIDPWEARDGTPYPDINVLTGDTVEFIYGTTAQQDVWIHASNTCEMGPDRERVKGFAGPSGSYTFTSDDAETYGGKVFFACDVGQRCENGQNLLAIVFPTEADRASVTGISTPTQAPVGSGTSGDDDDDDDDETDASAAIQVWLTFLGLLLSTLFV